MADFEQILADNLRDSLRLIQRYVILGVTASFSLLLIQLAESRETLTDSVSVPGLVIGVDPGMAKLLLAVFHIAAGFMAAFVVIRAKEIVLRIPGKEIKEAVTTYPCIATSGEGPVRIIPAIAPGLLFLWAVVQWISPQAGIDWIYLGSAFLMGVAPYLGLAYLLRTPIKKGGIQDDK